MTLNQFIDALAAIDDRTWRLNKDGQIESVEDELCPIHEVWLASDRGREEGLLGDWGAEADGLGLGPRVAKSVIDGADNRGSRRVRARLIEACGLEASP